MNTALLVVDIQNDYFPGGKMELQGSLEAAHQARRLLDCFRQGGQPVFFIQHLATRPGATFFLPGTPGAAIHESVRPQEGEPIFQKHTPNSFRETGLLDELRAKDITRLAICGMMTHMCVDATVRAAFDYGFECFTAADACATRDLKFEGQVIPAESVHKAFLAALNGTYGKVMGVQDLALALEIPGG